MDGILIVTPEVMKEKAADVTTQICKVETKMQEIQSIINKTKEYWIGDAGDLHRETYLRQETNVLEIIKRLKDHPRNLLIMAQVYSESELAIENLSNELPSDVLI